MSHVHARSRPMRRPLRLHWRGPSRCRCQHHLICLRPGSCLHLIRNHCPSHKPEKVVGYLLFCFITLIRIRLFFYRSLAESSHVLGSHEAPTDLPPTLDLPPPDQKPLPYPSAFERRSSGTDKELPTKPKPKFTSSRGEQSAENTPQSSPSSTPQQKKKFRSSIQLDSASQAVPKILPRPRASSV